jgi:hypothetical protein
MKTLICIITALCITSMTFSEVIVFASFGPTPRPHFRPVPRFENHFFAHERRLARAERMCRLNGRAIMETPEVVEVIRYNNQPVRYNRHEHMERNAEHNYHNDMNY